MKTISTLLILNFLILCSLLALSLHERAEKPAKTPILEQENHSDRYFLGDMTVTIYHAVPSQTDSTPMITASGFNLAGKDISSLRVCALSRDLLSRWGGPISYGDKIYLDLPDPELSGWWTVQDTMASRWTNHVDLLVPTSRKGGKWQEIKVWNK